MGEKYIVESRNMDQSFVPFTRRIQVAEDIRIDSDNWAQSSVGQFNTPMKAFLFSVFAILLISMSSRADDKVVSVDAANALITIDESGSLKAYRTKQFTEVTVNGAKAKLEQLRPGMTVKTSWRTRKRYQKLRRVAW
jgi:hypothetical protein